MNKTDKDLKEALAYYLRQYYFWRKRLMREPNITQAEYKSLIRKMGRAQFSITKVRDKIKGGIEHAKQYN